MRQSTLRARGLRAGISLIAAATMTGASLVGLATTASAAAGDVTVFGLTAQSAPAGVAQGPDGYLYTANYSSGTVSKVDSNGSVVANFALGANTGPTAIIAGPDGNLWLTLAGTNAIAKVTTAGTVTSYGIPTANSRPVDIAVGPDGALWFTEFNTNKIGRITTAGQVTAEYAVPTANAGVWGITPGPEGSNRMYFTEYTAGKIGFITMAGQVTETVATPANSRPQGIGLLANSVWFAQPGTSQLGHLVSDTTIAQLSVGAAVNDLVEGPGGGLWLTASNSILQTNNQGGVVGNYGLPAGATGPAGGPAVGSDGNVWFAVSGSSQIGRAASGVVPEVTAAPVLTPTTGITPGTPVAASNGTWNYASTYAYQWQRCSTSDVATCANIAGATAAAYTVTTTENGQFIRAGVSASNASGAAQASYSAPVAVGSATPTPKPAPAAATGPTASIGNGASVQILTPKKQKLGKRVVYEVVFTVTDVQGAVNLQFSKGSKRKIVSNLPIQNGTVKYSWKAKKNWKKGKATVTATYTAAPTSPYSSAAVKSTVKLK